MTSPSPSPLKTVTVGDHAVKQVVFHQKKPFVLIAGPCQLESAAHGLEMSQALVEITTELGIPFVYKTSFDKANRTSLSGARGLGMEKGLPILEDIRRRFKCPVVTDVHTESQCDPVGQVVDLLQIPAFLCRQTDLLKAAARTGKPLNIKKGQFLAPWDMINVIKKIEGFGNTQILQCERGACFGYNALVSDMRSLPILAQNGYPVVFDATHSVMEPGGSGTHSGGQRKFVEPLARAALSIGVSGLFIETHEDPDNAPSDGPNMIPLKALKPFLERLLAFDGLGKTHAFNLSAPFQEH